MGLVAPIGALAAHAGCARVTPQEYCQDKAGGSGSSFYYSFIFLPAPQRAAITALYAFCREVDDTVDNTEHADIAHAKLAWWRREIGDLYANQPHHPVTLALAPAVAAYRLPQDHFYEIIDGMEMDLTHTRYASFADLSVYCYRVASAVGLLSAAIFGYRDERTLGFARDLGMALQLTNILRDVGEDARRGRIYLPQEDLARFGVAAQDILTLRDSAALRALCAFAAERAQNFYDQAYAQLPETDRYSQLPSLMMARIYQTLLNELRADGFNVLNAKLSLTAVRKLWLAWRTLRQERRRHRRAPKYSEVLSSSRK